MGSSIPAWRSCNPSSTEATPKNSHNCFVCKNWLTGTAPCPYALAFTSVSSLTDGATCARTRAKLAANFVKSTSAQVGRKKVSLIYYSGNGPSSVFPAAVCAASACSLAGLVNNAYSPKNAKSISPTGPLRCLAIISVALFFSASSCE